MSANYGSNYGINEGRYSENAGGWDNGSEPGSPSGFRADSPSPQNKKSSIHPVTIKQFWLLTNPYDDITQCDKQDIFMIRIVAAIRSVSGGDERYTLYVVHDGTGSLEIKKWHSRDFDPSLSEESFENGYIAAVGKVQWFQNKPQFQAFNVQQITDYNEITHHYLEVLHTHLKANGSLANLHSGQRMINSRDIKCDNRGHMQGYPIGFTDLHVGIIEHVKEHGNVSENGLHVDNVCEKFSQVYGKTAGMQAIRWLIDEGHLYTTSDDDHVKSTQES